MKLIRCAAFASVALVAASSGCSGRSSSSISAAVVRYYPGGPPSVSGARVDASDGPLAVRLSNNQIAITTWDSGDCPSLPTRVTGHGQHEIDIITKEYKPNTPFCNFDLSPTTSTVQPPSGVNVAARLTVVIDGNSIVLPAR